MTQDLQELDQAYKNQNVYKCTYDFVKFEKNKKEVNKELIKL